MLVEIKNDGKLYAKFYIDFPNEKLDIEYGPDSTIKSIDNIFVYPDGYHFDFSTVRAFLRNRGINEGAKKRTYRKIDDAVEISIL